MTAIIEKINSLVKTAKKDKRLENVVFVKGYRSKLAKAPVEGFVAVVKIENINRLQSFAGGFFDGQRKGEMYAVKLAVDVYSGSDISGEDLSFVTLEVFEAIKSALEVGVIDSCCISPIAFDKTANAVYREIAIELSFCLSGENG